MTHIQNSVSGFSFDYFFDVIVFLFLGLVVVFDDDVRQYPRDEELYADED